ncbi:MAG: AAA family ATPase [bacterium]
MFTTRDYPYVEKDFRRKATISSEKIPGLLTITGPRQSGKTTLARKAFPNKEYVSLEDPDNKLFAANDPRGFLKTYEEAVIDEAQKVPELFSYIQTKVDMDNKTGQYILNKIISLLLFLVFHGLS